MIEFDELRQLYGVAMESMPATERDLIENYFLAEQSERDFRRARAMNRKEFVACMESALARMREFFKAQRIETVADVL
jgi:hypothetical protein